MTKKAEKAYFDTSFKLPNHGLGAYFGRVRKGQPDDYRTPFYKGKPVEQVLDDWDKHLVSIRDEWPTLYEFEIDLRSKVGPLSIMKPLKDRFDDIEAYYDSILRESEPIDDAALDALIEEWGGKIGGLTLKSQNQTVQDMKLTTSSGSPYFRRKRMVLSETIPCKVEYPEMTQYLGAQQHKFSMAAILGWRGQEGGLNEDDVKQRVVWMFPFSMNIQELRAYQPLIRACQRKQLVAAWISNTAVDVEITKLFNTKGSDDVIVCTDFTKFDQHFNQDMQDCARSLLQRLFTNNADFNFWLNNVFPIKYEIPLAYDWDKVRFGKHGMASGSGGTNADETLVHRTLQHEAALTAGRQLNPHSMCLGDDGVLTYPDIDVQHVVDTYSRHGQEMNIDKQYVSKDTVIYLRRWHHTDYVIDDINVGVYSTFRALGRLMHQERLYSNWSKEMVVLRSLSIIENCSNHPLREEFAEYCIKGDKYRLGLDIPGFFSTLERRWQQAKDEMPDFVSYNQSVMNDEKGILEWWIVQYLLAKLRNK